MNKIKNLIWFLTIAVLCALSYVLYISYTKQQKNETVPTPVFSDEFVNTSSGFSDGLTNPDSVTKYPLDEYNVGIAEKSIYFVDINNDKKNDRITKTFVETGNAHSYYEYKIELKQNGEFVDITPENFRTVNGADCDLQQIQFVFKPQFKVILISRDMGENWIEPKRATRQIFKLNQDKIELSNVKMLQPVCDVKELF